VAQLAATVVCNQSYRDEVIGSPFVPQHAELSQQETCSSNTRNAI
jgi:hypothetical protein